MTGPPQGLGEALLSLLESERDAEAKAGATAGEVRPRLTPLQSAVWVADRIDEGSSAFTMCRVWQIDGALDVSALGRALARLVARHDALRLRIDAVEGQPVPRLRDGADLRLEVEDAPDGVPGGDAWLDRRIGTMATTRLSPATAPLAARLFRLAPERAALCVALHHMLGDDRSLDLIGRDLGALYAAETGQGPDPAPLAPGYLGWMAGGDVSGGALRPRAAVAPLPWPRPQAALRAPGDDPAICRTATVRLPLPALADLRAGARAVGVTVFGLCAAAYQAVLSAWTGTPEVAIGVAYSTRLAPETQALVGLFIDYAGIVADVSGDPPLAALAADMQARIADARHGRAAGSGPVASATIVRYAADDPGLPLPGLSTRRHFPEVRSRATDLHTGLTEDAEGLRIEVQGRRRLFDAGDLAAFAAAYLHALTALSQRPDLRLSEIDLTGPDLRTRLAAAGVAAPPEGSDVTLPARFAAIAARYPDAPALRAGALRLTYAGLAAQAQAGAAWLRHGAGVEPGEAVALVLPSGAPMVIATLALLMAGAVVVPVDPAYPDARLAEMLAAAGAVRAICADADTAARMSRIAGQDGAGFGLVWPGEGAAHPGFVDGGPPSPSLRGEGGDGLAEGGLAAAARMVAPQCPPRLRSLPGSGDGGRGAGDTPARPSDPGAAAVIVFTSGSTGAPKGAVTPHRALVRLALGAYPVALGPGHRIAQLASPGFDGAFIEIWGALLNGAELVCPVAPPDGLAGIAGLLTDGAATNGAATGGAATGAFLTTGLFNLVVDEAPGALDRLQWVAVGGEAMSLPHVRRAQARCPGLIVLNGYGPTENGAFTTTWRVPRPWDAGAPGPDAWQGGGTAANDPAGDADTAPIGTPLPGNTVFVLDRHGRPLPHGFAGELWVGGAGLALGYAGDPARTAERFRRFDPVTLGLPPGPDLRLYGTGDRVRWRADLSVLDCLGRLDGQVKFNGYRIEPGEIEAALSALPGIAKAAVWAEREGPGGAVSALVAAYETAGDGAPDPASVRAGLAARLPRFLMPTRLIALDSLPLTVNGKVDRRALAAAPPVQTADPGGIDPALAAIWQRLLGGPPPGPDADFFAAGGHSLLAFRMLAEVERATGRVLPVQPFLSDPRLGTLDRMVRRAGSAAAQAPRPGLRLLRTGDPAAVPLFCVPGLLGNGMWAGAMVPGMAAHAGPILALAIDDAADDPGLPRDMAALADRLIDTALAALPDAAGAPLNLVGYSLGGFLAFVMAERIEARGLVPGRLILIDPNTNLFPDPFAPPASDRGFPQDYLRDLRRAHPMRQIAADIDFVHCTRDFPLPRPVDAAEWAILTRGEVRVHRVAAHHLSVTHAGWGPFVGARIAAIVEGGAVPEARLAMPWPADRLAQAQQVAQAVRAGDPARAEALCRGGQGYAWTEPRFARRQRLLLAAAGGRAGPLWRAALAAWRHPGAWSRLDLATLAVGFEHMGRRCAARRVWWRLVRMSAAQGTAEGTYILMHRILAAGRRTEARRLVRHLDALPARGVEGELALALMAGEAGQRDAVAAHVTAALGHGDLSPAHVVRLLREVLGPRDGAIAAQVLAVARRLFGAEPEIAAAQAYWSGLDGAARA